MQEMIDKYYTTDEVATLLKVSVRTVRTLIGQKKLKASLVGRDYRIAETDLKKFLGEAP